MRRVNAEALIHTYDLFHEIDEAYAENASAETFDISDVWVIAQDLSQRKASLPTCKICGLLFVVTEDPLVPPTCPFCVNRKARRLKRKHGHGDQVES